MDTGNNSLPTAEAPQNQTTPTEVNDTKPVSGKQLLVGNLCIFTATVFWGLNVSVTKALIPEWMPANAVTMARLIPGCILFWLTSLFVKTEKIEKGDWGHILLGGFVGMFGFIILFITSLKYGNPIDISIIETLPPIFVILIGVTFLHRRPGMLEYIGIVISFIGAAIVILDGNNRGANGSDNVLGDILAIASAVCFAFYLVILEKPSKKYKPVTLMRWVFLFAAIPACFLFKSLEHLPLLHAHEALPWIYIIFIVVCPTFLAYFLMEPAIKRIGSELVSIYQYLIPVFATVSAVLLLNDRLRWLQGLAMAVIVLGMAFTIFGKRKRVKKYGRDD